MRSARSAMSGRTESYRYSQIHREPDMTASTTSGKSGFGVHPAWKSESISV